MRILLLLLAALPGFGADQETRLVDRLVKAQRKVERANKASEEAGAKITAYCLSQRMELRIKPNGLLGCVVVPPPPKPEPPKPPEPAKPEPAKPDAPKTPEAKPTP